MTLHRERGEIVWECDGCDATLPTSTEDFAEARHELSAEGWATRREADDWAHLCAKCKRRRG